MAGPSIDEEEARPQALWNFSIDDSDDLAGILGVKETISHDQTDKTERLSLLALPSGSVMTFFNNLINSQWSVSH
jgi:hypothetical protein